MLLTVSSKSPRTNTSETCANFDIGVAAVRVARKLGRGRTIVTILCDSGTKHISKFWAKAGSVGGETKCRLEDIIGQED